MRINRKVRLSERKLTAFPRRVAALRKRRVKPLSDLGDILVQFIPFIYYNTLLYSAFLLLYLLLYFTAFRLGLCIVVSLPIL